VYQDLVRVNKAIEEKELDENPYYSRRRLCEGQSKAFHLMGLVSDGWCSLHLSHLKGNLPPLQKNNGVKNLSFMRFWMAATQTPRLVLVISRIFKPFVQNKPARCIIGRYYAMDRASVGSVLKLAYDLL